MTTTVSDAAANPSASSPAIEADSSSPKVAKILDGKGCAAQIRLEIKQEVEEILAKSAKTAKHHLPPGLAVILVGERPDSATYVRNKTKACVECGFHVEDFKLEESISEQELLTLMDKLNFDEAFHGILVQLPLPTHINAHKVLERIRVEKDVDGFLPYNLGCLAARDRHPSATACTPAGVLELLKRNRIEIAGKKVVILGRSNIVGIPLALLMLHSDATVVICHSKTPDLETECKQADILCCAMGKAEFIDQQSFIKENAVVVDIGINSKDAPELKKGYRLCGDVKFDEIAKVASFITPVPGGVGPMTIAMLLKNTLELWKRSRIVEGVIENECEVGQDEMLKKAA